MSKKLAIKSHITRGKEVIELLKMMGGINESNLSGKGENSIYYLRYYVDNVAADILYQTYPNTNDADFKIFTLEEFLEKYPYKVGDKVNSPCKGCIKTITSMKWDECLNTVSYKLDDKIYTTIEQLKVVNDLPYKETDDIKHSDSKCERTHEDVIFDSIIWHLRNSVNNGKQHLSGGECEEYFREVVKKNNENKMKSVFAELLEHIKTTPKEELEREFEEIKEWSNVGPTVEEFRAFCECVNKKPKYPKTYEECCQIIGGVVTEIYLQYNVRPSYKFEENLRDLLESLRKLIICRNAYWKIAGEQMGLGKPWDSTYGCGEWGYWVGYSINENKIYLQDSRILVNHTLVFPTEEMRDAFYENFKDLIEQCKELL